ncbi:GAF domain-containing protein [Cnuibacter physcomitrellae]|uniref:helix-turn-helix domain-containing protein n=1 Tax=Cnuibacter physcomitrellae TaxID=1619308 RepID=UPI0021761346|nr:GAF domain-containing protein [Cnuibacter physcomitrellae]MCS5498564.1 GAF domain-containing protein [Cnuibacter physcomitrellae]
MTDELTVWLDRLRILSDVASGGMPLAEALTLVAETARTLLGFDFCGVLVPDTDRQALVLAGWSGLSDEYVDGINRRNPVGLASTAPSSRAFHAGAPVAVADIETEQGFAPWGGVAHEQGYRSMISVPLRGPDRALGTLNGYHSRAHDHTAEEIERMTLLANHAAAALASAGLVEQLRLANGSLREQRDRLERSQAMHHSLLQVSLESRGIGGVLEATQGLIHRPLRLLDSHGEVIGEAGTWRTEGRELATPVRLEAEVVGTLVVCDLDGMRLDELDELAIGHAVVVLALELLRERTVLEAEFRLHGDLLSDVLLFGVTEQNVRRAEALGRDLHRMTCAVVATFELAPAGEPHADDIAGREREDVPMSDGRLLSALSMLSRTQVTVDGVTVTPLVAIHRGLLVAMWPDTVDADTAARACHRTLTAGLPSRQVLVASSGSARRSLPEAVRIARGTHAFVRASGRSVDAPVAPASLGVVGVLLQVENTAALREFVTDQVGSVLDYDARRGSDLLRTLHVHLDNGLDRTATGAVLRVHPNTVNQRLRRIEQLTGRSLTDPASLLGFSAAVAMLTMLPPGEGAVTG